MLASSKFALRARRELASCLDRLDALIYGRYRLRRGKADDTSVHKHEEMKVAEPGLARLLTAKKSLEPMAASSFAQPRVTNLASVSIP